MTPKSEYFNSWKVKKRSEYLLNKQQYRNKIVQRNSEIVNRFKMKPCMDCGVQYNPWVMDLDHRPNEVKTANVSRLRLQSTSIKTLEREMAKCDVVCANCHRERTQARFKGY